ncbi:precorrin-8X methylmutase [Desulfonatronospira sp.]|uniref:precorrin-8X methylmutase n=1 Tax=Desulfonatronospira sp. TaxID=1962951 RepID=UPI0025B9B685|nr:precorrin-8X methylmutase [Desulfonatronospira sp.]
MLPQEIEQKSMQIIAREALGHGFNPQEWAVVSRMIHTSADFDYLKSIRIHSLAIESGIKAIKQGRSVITDTNMALAGLRKNDLAGFGCHTLCFIQDPRAARMAREHETTRAEAAVDLALDHMQGSIYVVGNAPTALMRLISLIQEGRASPALVVGLPVGFVNAAESKAELAGMKVPHITNHGRKGGSNVAAAVVNSLVIMAASNET